MKRNDKDRDFKNSNLFRYRNRKMTEGERYDYERQLQKDPFESDALEGLQSLSSEEIAKDMGAIRKRLSKIIRPVGLSKILRIAAVAVVLVGVSSLFLVREMRKPPRMISEIIEKAEQESEIIEIVKPQTDITEREETFDKMPVEALEAVKAVEEEIYTDKISDKFYDPDGVKKKETIGGVNIISVDEVADEAIVTTPVQVSKSMKRAVVVEEPELLFPGEVAMEEDDYEREVPEVEEGEVVGYIAPVPVGGLRVFKEYIKEHQLFPESWNESGREVVRLKFQVGIDSVITNIEIVKSPGDLFSNEAIRLINEGPVWIPATRNGLAVVDSVKLRIVFRRQQ